QVQPGAQVGHRNADSPRSLAGRPGDGHESTDALRDLVDAGALRVRAVLAEARDAAVDDAWIELAHGLVVHFQAVLHLGPEILNHLVGVTSQPIEHLTSELAL